MTVSQKIFDHEGLYIQYLEGENIKMHVTGQIMTKSLSTKGFSTIQVDGRAHWYGLKEKLHRLHGH